MCSELRRTEKVGRFDDDRADRESADEPIPLRKRAAERHHPGRRFAEHATARGHVPRERFMLRRIDFQEAAAEHGDRTTAGVERATMGGPVDSARQAAHDRETNARQPGSQFLGLRQAIARGVASSDDGDGQIV